MSPNGKIATLVELSKQINERLAGLPAGSPERIARMKEIGREYLAAAKTDSERRFWRAFIGERT